MMFITPMPPTSSETDAIADSISPIVSALSCCKRIESSGARRLKLSLPSSGIRWRTRSSSAMCSCAGGMAPGVAAEHMMSSTLVAGLLM